MEITNDNQISWMEKYFVVEGKSFYQGDGFTVQKIFTTKNEAILAAKDLQNSGSTDLTQGFSTRVRTRHLTTTEVARLEQGPWAKN